MFSVQISTLIGLGQAWSVQWIELYIFTIYSDVLFAQRSPNGWGTT